MKNSRRKFKLMLCLLLTTVSVFAFSGCELKKFFYTMTTESAALGERMGRETAEALLENENSRSWILKIDNAIYSLLVKVIG